MIEINLLETKKKTKDTNLSISYDSQVITLSFIAVIVIEIIALALFTFHINNRIETLTNKRSHLRSVEVEVKKIQLKLKEVKLMINTVKKLENNRGRATHILDEIASVMPKYGLWLTKMAKKGKVLSIAGKSFSTEAVAKYMTNIGNLKDVSKVRFDSRGLSKIKQKGTDVYQFFISVQFKD